MTHVLGDETLALLRRGYPFISEQARRREVDVFETGLLLRPTICMTGEEAARVFYDNELFSRHGAMPSRAQKTLLGVGGVQGLDGEEHAVRKGAFMSCLHPVGAQQLASQFSVDLREAVERWEFEADTVVLLDAVARVLMRSVCTWTGVPLPSDEEDLRTAQMLAMIDAPAAIGPRHVRGRRARTAADAWAAGLVDCVRRGELDPSPGTALSVFAGHNSALADELEPHTAGVELLNVLRPTVAVNRFVAFAALALHLHPEWRERLRSSAADNGSAIEAFVHEVRRLAPFFPAVAARVRRDFEWHGVAFPRGRSVLLDLFGTNRDSRSWDRPLAFDPERFLGRTGRAFHLIPQGGGDHSSGHRCAGEWATIELLGVAVRFLASEMDYNVPPQDLSVPLARIPTAPRSGFVMSHIRLRG